MDVLKLKEGKCFRLVEDEFLEDFMNDLKQYLPESTKMYETVKTYLRKDIFKFYFYVSKTWPEQPICIQIPGMSVSTNDTPYESFHVFCPSNQLDLLKLFYEEDILINWGKPLSFNLVHQSIAEHIQNHYKAIGKMEVTELQLYLQKVDPEDNESAPLDGVEIKQLEIQHAELIHSMYPAKHVESVELFEKIIANLPAVGVFTDGVLSAWILQSYYGAMFSMQTLPEYRRRGYGVAMARYLLSLVKEGDYIPHVYIRSENIPSSKLFEKLGFQPQYKVVRGFLTPFEGLEEREDQPF